MENKRGINGERRSPEEIEAEPTNESVTRSTSPHPVEGRLQDRLEQAQTVFEGQLTGLLKQLRTPLKQVEEWVNRGDLQSVVDQLQEKAHRAQEEVERRLHALDEVRQGLEVHVKKQLEEFRRDRQDLTERAEAATPEVADPEPPPRTAPAAKTPPPAKTTNTAKTKKPRAKKPPKSSEH